MNRVELFEFSVKSTQMVGTESLQFFDISFAPQDILSPQNTDLFVLLQKFTSLLVIYTSFFPTIMTDCVCICRCCRICALMICAPIVGHTQENCFSRVTVTFLVWRNGMSQNLVASVRKAGSSLILLVRSKWVTPWWSWALAFDSRRRKQLWESSVSSPSLRKTTWSRLWQGPTLTRWVRWQLMETCEPMRSKTPCSASKEPPFWALCSSPNGKKNIESRRVFLADSKWQCWRCNVQ